MGKKKLKRKIANLEDDMSSLLIENEKLRNIISGMQSYVKSYWGTEIKVIDQNGIVEFKNNQSQSLRARADICEKLQILALFLFKEY